MLGVTVILWKVSSAISITIIIFWTNRFVLNPNRFSHLICIKSDCTCVRFAIQTVFRAKYFATNIHHKRLYLCSNCNCSMRSWEAKTWYWCANQLINYLISLILKSNICFVKTMYISNVRSVENKKWFCWLQTNFVQTWKRFKKIRWLCQRDSENRLRCMSMLSL